MGVTNPNDYDVIEHASQRITERFNVIKSEQSKWINRLMQTAKFVKKDNSDGHHREVWRNKEISFVIDTRKKVVVSVWSEDSGRAVKASKAKDINPTVSARIHETIDSIKHQTLRKRCSDTASLYHKVSELVYQISRTRNFELMDQKEKQVQKLLRQISLSNDGYVDIIKSAEGII